MNRTTIVSACNPNAGCGVSVSPLASVHLSPSQGVPLPDRLRWALEALSGFDMSDVRVHFGSELPAEVGARAFAYGKDIHVASGVDHVLAHEAWHVVQQKQGRVPQTALVNGTRLNDDPSLELEADVMGDAAERLSTSRALEDWPCAVLGRQKAVRPVVQRVVTIGDDVVLTAKAIREKLNIWHEITANNTPHLQTIVDDIFEKKRTFPDLNALKTEVRQRSFGLRHVEAMNEMRKAHVVNLTNYMRTNNYRSSRDMEKILDYFSKASGSQRALGQVKYPRPTFIYWGAKTDFSRIPHVTMVRNTEILRWVRNQPNSGNPLGMNCWEAVLYGGAWDNNNTRVPLYNRDYAFWALQNVVIPSMTYANPIDMNVPFFISHIVNNPKYHATRQNTVNRCPPIPDEIFSGMIVLFSCGSHVALATGERREIMNEEARNFYGSQGHEIMELDASTLGLERTTIEDTLYRKQVYTYEIHFGWLPDNTTAQTVTLQDLVSGGNLHQVYLPVTNFYT